MPRVLLVIVLIGVVPLVAAYAGGPRVTTPSGETLPACPPRAASEAARLNVALFAQDYGVMPPCKAEISFYIARNTALRSLQGVLRLSGDAGDVERPFALTLERSNAGMYQGDWRAQGATDASCRALEAHLRITGCSDGKGTSIECPVLRVKPSPVFQRVSAQTSGAGVCTE